MSTFTDWNGPGCGGGSLPQVRTLEALLMRLTQIEQSLTTIGNSLTTHESKSAVTDQMLHGIQSYVNGLINDTKQLIATETNRAVDKEGNLDKKIDTEKLALQSAIADAKSEAISDAKGYTEGRLGTIPNSQTVKQFVDTVQAGIEAKIVDIKTAFKTNTIDTNGAARLTISNLIDALEGIHGKIYPQHIIDYRNFDYVLCPNVAITDPDSLSSIPGVDISIIPRNAVALIGALSTEYYKPGDGVETFDNQPDQAHKPARVYLKYCDSEPWNAILDLVVTRESDGGKYNGAITATFVKTHARKYIGFGLYYATDTKGKPRVYLGVKVSDVITYLTETPHITWANFHMYVAGVNFLPISNAIAPNSAVNEITTIATTFVAGDSGVGSSKLTIENIFTKDIRDIAGHGMLLTDEDDDVLRLGAPDNTVDKDFPGTTNKTHALEIYAKARPNVFLGDGGSSPMSGYRMAFLEDLAQSIYFQRDVVISVNNKDALDELNVWQINGKVVPPRSTGSTAVPGFYTMDPTGSTTSGHIFKEGDTVLLKDSKVTERAPDGYINTTLEAGTGKDYPVELITGLPHVIAGATVVDNTGQYGKVQSLDASKTLARIVIINESDLYDYSLPAYITRNANGWDAIVTIGLPKADPGEYLHDISYEWMGSVGPFTRDGSDQPYYEPGYEVWTPHHQNPTWDKDEKGQPNAAWANIHFDLDGYRSAVRQDQIDNALEGLATVQPDYGEMTSIAEYQLPEGSKQTIANPAYIHNRPWTGLAVLDGGSFGETPLMYPNWLVDGGDFSDYAVDQIPGWVNPAVSADNQFKNVIMRLWHGLYADMPEIQRSTIDGVWKNFRRTLRWTDDVNDKALWYSDGEKLFKILPYMQKYVVDTGFNYEATSEFFHEHDGGGYRYNAGGVTAFGGGNYGAADAKDIWYEIYVRKDADSKGTRLIFTSTKVYYTKGKADSTYVADDELVVLGQLNQEIARATAAENGLRTDLNQEISDRTNDVNAEKQRATAAENGLRTDLNQEISDRTNDVNAEKQRATTAEGVISGNLTNHIDDTVKHFTGTEKADLLNDVGTLKTDVAGLKTGKADKTYVDTQDALKADKTYVDTQDALKADKTYVDTQDALKADKTYVDTQDALKADKTYVDTQDALKADKTGTGSLAEEVSRATAAESAIAGRVPIPTSTLADGQYKLVVTMASGVPTYSWEVV